MRHFLDMTLIIAIFIGHIDVAKCYIMRVYVITCGNILRGISDQLRIFTHLCAVADRLGGNFMARRNKARRAQVFDNSADFQCMGCGDDIVGWV